MIEFNSSVTSEKMRIHKKKISPWPTLVPLRSENSSNLNSQQQQQPSQFEEDCCCGISTMDHKKVHHTSKSTPAIKTFQQLTSNLVEVRRKFSSIFSPWSLVIFLLLMNSGTVMGNILPQFLLSDGQSEIVLRLKEGPMTPVGSLIYTLKGIDRDGDPLTFGLKGQIANELLRIENRGRDSANLFLKKELDREVRRINCSANEFI